MREELLKEYAEEALKNGPHRFIRPDDKIFYMDGFKDGYNLGLKAIINRTTISDAPAIPAPETECNECGKLCTPSEMTDDRRMCKDCYIKWLEGQYKEHREQIEKMKWHKVSDGDLPKDRHNVYVVYLNGYYQLQKTIASFRHKYWVFNGLKTEYEVIAWCELPKWEIKEK